MNRCSPSAGPGVDVGREKRIYPWGNRLRVFSGVNTSKTTQISPKYPFSSIYKPLKTQYPSFFVMATNQKVRCSNHLGPHQILKDLQISSHSPLSI